MDIEYLLWLQGLREAWGPVVEAFFNLVSSTALSAVVLLAACVVYWCVDKSRGLFVAASYGASVMVNQLVKNTVCCYRPWVRDARVVPSAAALPGATGYSFPSGHTQAATSGALGLGWAWRERRWPVAAGLALTILVAFSRNFLGVHTPQDVLASFVETCLVMWLVERLLARVDAGESHDALVLGVGLVVLLVSLAYVTLKPYPLDYVGGSLLVDPDDMLQDCYEAAGCFLGLLAGWYGERRWVGFSTQGLSRRERLVRLGVGLLVVLPAYLVGHVLKVPLGVLWGPFVEYALLFVAVLALAPATFMLLHDRAAH